MADATKFILERWQNETSSSASASSHATAASSTAGAKTGAPASSTSATTAAASAKDVFQAAGLSIATLIALLSFN